MVRWVLIKHQTSPPSFNYYMMLEHYQVLLLGLSAFVQFAASHCKDARGFTTNICVNSTTKGLCFGKTLMFVMPCPNNKPHCEENGICGTYPIFECPGSFDGYFPNPWECSEFHYCLGQVKDTIVCGKDQVYDPIKQSCAKRSSQKPCHEFNCSKKQNGEGAAYSGDLQVYTLCEDGKPTTVVERCEEGLAFDEERQDCVFVCQDEGNFKDPASSDFFECTNISGNQFNKLKRTCMSGTEFDSNKGYCVKSTSTTTASSVSSSTTPSS